MERPWAVRPDLTEYAEFYRGYVAKVPDGDVIATLESEGERAVGLYRGLTEARANHAYAPGKWTVRELLAHVSDSERAFSYRALCFGRNDPTPLPGLDQELWLPHAHAASRRWTDLIDEFRAVRAATLHLVRSFEPEDWMRRGTANGAEVSVRAAVWIAAGHEMHHRSVLAERYGIR
jgi:uncharacterized damage-inducible protein DinB